MPDINILGKFNSKAADGVIADSKQIKGGYMVVANTTELGGLSTEVAPIGTQAYVQSEGLVYIKDSSGWVVYETLNLENGPGEFTLQQKGEDSSDIHTKGGSAIGDNSIAFGVGDVYTFTGTTVYGQDLKNRIYYSEVNPNWQNMVCYLIEANRYVRITEVNTTDGYFVVDVSLTPTGGSIEFSILTQAAMGKVSSVKGEYNQAFGEAATAEGIATKAVGDASHSEGFYTLANQAYSHAEGMYTIAAGIAQTVVGKYNKINFDNLFIVGNGTGTASADRSNAFEVLADGRAKVGAGPEDDDDVVNKGYDNLQNTGNKSIIQKATNPNIATGSTSVTLGTGNSNNGGYTVVEGGSNTVTLGGFGHVEGQNNRINPNSTADINAFHVEGVGNVLYNTGAHIQGFNNKSSKDYQFVSGIYNADDANALVIIGNGTGTDGDPNRRRNAFVVKADGRAKVQAGPSNSSDALAVLRLADVNTSAGYLAYGSSLDLSQTAKDAIDRMNSLGFYS